MVKPQQSYRFSNGTTSINTNNNTYYYKPTNPAPTKQPESSVYKPHSTTYKPPSTTYKPPSNRYEAPTTTYKPPSCTYEPPSTAYKPPSNTNGLPATTYEPPVSTAPKPPSNTWKQQVSATESQDYDKNIFQNNQRVQEAKAQRTVTQSMNNLSINVDFAERNQSSITPATSQTAVQRFLQRRRQASTLQLETDIQDDDSGRQTLSSGK